MSTIGYGGMLIVASWDFGCNVAAIMQYVLNVELNPDQEKATVLSVA
jgi:hypothetical protein